MQLRMIDFLNLWELDRKLNYNKDEVLAIVQVGLTNLE